MQMGVKHAIADFTPDTPESAACSKARAVARLVNSCGEKVVKRQHIRDLSPIFLQEIKILESWLLIRVGRSAPEHESQLRQGRLSHRAASPSLRQWASPRAMPCLCRATSWPCLAGHENPTN